MKQILFIAYQYPPFGGAGVQRTLKFSKYLPAYDWCPVVLTAKSEYARLLDPSLQAEIPKGVPVQRTQALLPPGQLPFRVRNFLSRWLLITDEQLGWYPFAVSVGKSLLQSQDISILYSTSAPYTDHLIGYALHKHSKLPWVVDLRDPWIGNFGRQYPTRLHADLDNKLESVVVHTADRVIVVSQQMKVDLLQRYRDIPPEKIAVITNGFDSADFSHTDHVSISPDRLTIVYTGSFYSKELTPQNFLKGLKIAFSSGRVPHTRVEVFLVGNLGRLTEDMIHSSTLKELIHTPGYLSHQQSIAYLTDADLLLLIIGASKNSQSVFTGKIFEYLAAKKPILALVPSGPAADLIHEVKAGDVIDPEDPEAIADAITLAYDRWRRGELAIEPRQDIIDRYERKKLTASLASLLDELRIEKL